jgi:hypothetical protein
MVVMGMYIFRFGLSITISPGSRPMGTLPSHGHRSPTARNIAPSMISVFCMANLVHSSLYKQKIIFSRPFYTVEQKNKKRTSDSAEYPARGYDFPLSPVLYNQHRESPTKSDQVNGCPFVFIFGQAKMNINKIGT